MIRGDNLKDNTISLCMIVKNEEKNIENCLNNLKNNIDEIIIVDTGSTDNTVALCKKYTHNIYNFEWTGDFSAARNMSLTLAKKKWILWLDADEECSPDQFTNLKNTLNNTLNNVFFLPIINYVGKQISETDVYRIFQPRLFRRDAGCSFYNSIHETLHIPVEKYQYDIIPFPIKHYGYLNSQIESKKKYQRNFEILQVELKNPYHSPWIEYHLASEYYNLSLYNEALRYINTSILNFLIQNCLPPALVYRLKYDILMRTQNINQGWPNINSAIKLYPDYVDLHFIKANFLFYLKKYQDAINILEHCLILGEDNPKYLILKGTGSFRAHKLLQKCLNYLSEE